MTKIRKPRTPKIDKLAARKLKDAISDTDLFSTGVRFEYYETLRERGELPTSFIAFEAVAALAGGKNSQRNDEELKSIWPESWGEHGVTIPLKVALTLSSYWRDYRKSKSEFTMGEMLELEGGYKGARRIKSRLDTIDKDLVLAREVEFKYLFGQFEDKPVHLKDAITFVANMHKISFAQVKSAHKFHREFIRNRLREIGVLTG